MRLITGPPGSGKSTLAVLAVALLLVACDGLIPTEPSVKLVPVTTKHGTIHVDPAIDPASVAHHVEAGFARARARIDDPSRLSHVSIDGTRILATLHSTCVYRDFLTIEVTAENPQCLAHEVQHLHADWLRLSANCVRWQDHHFDSPFGSCDLDGRWGER